MYRFSSAKYSKGTGFVPPAHEYLDNIYLFLFPYLSVQVYLTLFTLRYLYRDIAAYLITGITVNSSALGALMLSRARYRKPLKLKQQEKNYQTLDYVQSTNLFEDPPKG